MSSPSSAAVVAVSASTVVTDGVPRVKLNRAYTDALLGAGLVPLVVPPLPAAMAKHVLDAVRGLVLTGGEDVAPRRYGAEPHPSVDDVHELRDECELALVRAARERGIPTLAICRGIQLANVAFGGTLVQDIPSERRGADCHDPHAARDRRVHLVHVDDGSTLAGALGARRITTNSMHHQSVDRLGDHLRVSARSTDGIVEGIEWADSSWWMVGVQWHPEELVRDPEPWDRQLFAAFARRCEERGRGE